MVYTCLHSPAKSRTVTYLSIQRSLWNSVNTVKLLKASLRWKSTTSQFELWQLNDKFNTDTVATLVLWVALSPLRQTLALLKLWLKCPALYWLMHQREPGRHTSTLNDPDLATDGRDAERRSHQKMWQLAAQSPLFVHFPKYNRLLLLRPWREQYQIHFAKINICVFLFWNLLAAAVAWQRFPFLTGLVRPAGFPHQDVGCFFSDCWLKGKDKQGEGQSAQELLLCCHNSTCHHTAAESLTVCSEHRAATQDTLLSLMTTVYTASDRRLFTTDWWA